MKGRQLIGSSRYRLLSRLGLGGFGEVFLAEGPQGLVAIKAVDTGGWSPREYQVFNALMVSEAAFLSTLSHPALPKLREFFAEGSRYFLVMDWVSGQTLEEAIETSGPFDLGEAFRLLNELLAALEYLHDECRPAIVFGDLKPANVLRTQQGDYRLVDFGLVTRQGSRLTGDFAVYSPPFSAPERASGKASSIRQDVYSLAATVLYSLTGHPPTLGEVEPLLRQRSLHEHFEAGQRRRAEQLLTVLLACLEPDPEFRPVTLAPLRAAWERWSNQRHAPRPAQDILRGLYEHKDGEMKKET